MQACSSMRHVVCGGEAMPAALVARCRQVLPHATLHNDYGPTEATIACTGTFQQHNQAWQHPCMPHSSGLPTWVGARSRAQCDS